jgi:hypothetical protein
MQGLADLAMGDPVITEQIRVLTRTGTPAMRARGRKLLAKFESAQNVTGATTAMRKPDTRPSNSRR